MSRTHTASRSRGALEVSTPCRGMSLNPSAEKAVGETHDALEHWAILEKRTRSASIPILTPFHAFVVRANIRRIAGQTIVASAGCSRRLTELNLPSDLNYLVPARLAIYLCIGISQILEHGKEEGLVVRQILWEAVLG